MPRPDLWEFFPGPVLLCPSLSLPHQFCPSILLHLFSELVATALCTYKHVQKDQDVGISTRFFF